MPVNVRICASLQSLRVESPPPLPVSRPAASVVLAVVGAVAVALLRDPAAHAVALVSLTCAWGVLVAALPTPEGTRAIPLVAVLVRLPLLTLLPTLSDDVYRYVWEGEVWRHGVNPFVHAPDSAALAAFRDEVWARVNHRSVPTVYPPVAQALFVILSGGGVFAWRVFSSACDVGTALLLARRSPRAGWLWALLPLPALESAVSGHLEGVGVLLLVAALRPGGGLFAWLGAMVKLLPGVLLLLERRRRWPMWLALTLLVTVPIVRVDGFETYRATWAYNGSIFPVAAMVLGEQARPALQVIGGVVVGLAAMRTRDRAHLALWTTGAFVLLSPTVHPWYVLWPLAAALYAGASRAWIVLAVTVPYSYVVLSTYDATTSTWTESPWTRVAVYAPFYAWLLRDGWRRWTRAGPF